jgi:hypothetical protein
VRARERYEIPSFAAFHLQQQQMSSTSNDQSGSSHPSGQSTGPISQSPLPNQTEHSMQHTVPQHGTAGAFAGTAGALGTAAGTLGAGGVASGAMMSPRFTGGPPVQPYPGAAYQMPPEYLAQEYANRQRLPIPKFRAWSSFASAMKQHLVNHGRWDVVERRVPGMSTAMSIVDDSDDIGFHDADTLASSEVNFAPHPLQVVKAGIAWSEINHAIQNSDVEEAKTITLDVPEGNAYALWHRLKTHFEKVNLATYSMLKHEVNSFRQRPHETVPAYIARGNKLVYDLQQCTTDRRQLPMQERVFMLVEGLNSKFDLARTNLQMTKNASWSDVCEFLVSQESFMQRRAAMGSSDTGKPRTAGAHALTAEQIAQMICNSCGKKGHLANKCQNKKKNSSQTGGSNNRPPSSGVVCSWCGKPNHTEDVCYSRRDGKPRSNHAGSSPAVPASSASASSASSSASANKPVSGGSLLTQSSGSTVSAQACTILTTASTVVSAASAAPAAVWDLDAESDILIDSGAGMHVWKGTSAPLLNERTDSDTRISVASGEIFTDPTRGTKWLGSAGLAPIELTNVLKHDGIKTNMLSVSALCQHPDVKGVWMDARGTTVYNHVGNALLRGIAVDGVYKVEKNHHGAPSISASAAITAPVPDQTSAAAVPDHPVNPPVPTNQPPTSSSDQILLAPTSAPATKVGSDPAVLMHQRLAHLAADGIDKLITSKAVVGIEAIKPGSFTAQHICPGCIQGKSHRAAFGKTAPPLTADVRILGCMLVDTIGPFQATSLGGSKYMMLAVDKKTRKIWPMFQTNRSQTSSDLPALITRLQVEKGLVLQHLHTDGAREFQDSDITEFCKRNGTTQTITTPHTPQHNGIVERAMRYVIEAARAVMHHSGAPHSLWAEACAHVILIRNLTGIRRGVNFPPDQLWDERLQEQSSKPSLHHLRVWGCDAWVHIPDADRRKLDAKARLCLYLGMNAAATYHTFLHVPDMKIVISRDARFDETSFTQCRALRLSELHASDSPAAPASDAEYVDFVQDARFRTEIKLAELISKEEQSAPSAPAASPVIAPVAPSPASDSAAPARRDEAIDYERIGLPLERLPTVPEESASVSSDPDWIPSGELPMSSTDDSPEHRHGDRLHRSAHDRTTNRYGMVSWEDVGAYYANSVTVMCNNIATLTPGAEPNTIAEAMRGSERTKWSESITAEVDALDRNATWEIVNQLPPGRKAIGTRMVFKRKMDASGTVVMRYKARLVAKGFLQREGVDYHETFAPVLGYSSLRVIFAIVASLDLEFVHLDVETAFLNATLQEEIYITLPAGFFEHGFKACDTAAATPGTILRLKKSLYGIKQAPHDWHQLIDKVIQSLGYAQCLSEACIYFKVSKTGKPMFICLFVDDMPSAYHASDKTEWDADKAALMRRFKIQDLGDAKLILGMRITRDRRERTLKVDQEAYIKKVLEKWHMQDCIPVHTPEVEGIHLSAFPSGSDQEQSTRSHPPQYVEFDAMTHSEYAFGSAVGSVSYAAVTSRPDISHAVGVLSRFLGNPLPHHWDAMKRLLRYLKGTAHLGLTYRGDPNMKDAMHVTIGPVFTDANWAGCVDDRKSTSGMVAKINGTAVAWKSKKQTTVALSSAEAEYIAASEASREVIWLRQLMHQIRMQQRVGTTLLCDNETAIGIAQRSTSSARMKHIDIRHHFVRDHLVKGDIQIEWISTQDQEADIFTKALGRNIFGDLRARIMGFTPAPAGECKDVSLLDATKENDEWI